MASTEVFASRYKILRTVGSGGMGTVYQVEDLRHRGRVCALKALHAVEDAEAVEAFRSEFRNIRGVVHPNIPEMHDFGTVQEGENRSVYYFTCEFCDGQSLDKLCDQWSHEQLRQILVALCRALSFIHSRGLLHRDIKPENVLARLSGDGSFDMLKLVDFGLASGKDVTGSHVSGTIDYLAPELIAGGGATVASDIYALGMLLYRVATGRLPFDGSDALGKSKVRASSEAPSPLRYRADLPVGLADVISTLIRVDSADRPPTSRHVIALLNEREGTEYPYETPDTRAAYIRSAASVSNAAAHAQLAQLAARLHTSTPPSVIITAPRGLGCSRLLREFGQEIVMDGISARVVHNDSDLDSTDPVRVLIVPDERAVTLEWLYAVLESAHRTGVWCIISRSQPDDQLEQVLRPFVRIDLKPMDLTAVAEFVQATFPGHAFPSSFNEELHRWTLGLAASLQSAFDQLLRSESVQIGLNGWELNPGNRTYKVHESVARFVDSHREKLSSTAIDLLNALVCSPAPLPRPIIESVVTDIEEHNIAASIADLVSLEWVDLENDEFSLRFDCIRAHILAGLPPSALTAIHRQLAKAWDDPRLADHARRNQYSFYHRLHSGDWTVDVEEARALLREAVYKGEHHWLRSLTGAPYPRVADNSIRTMLAEALAEVEFIQGNFSAASELLQSIAEVQSEDYSSDNLRRLIRFAVIQEKLGHTEIAEDVLRRCQAALPAGQSSEAASVLGTLGWICFKRGEREMAQQLAEEGLLRVPPGTEDSGLAMLLNVVATLAFYRAEPEAAALAWQRCLEVNEAIGDRKGIANMYNNLGVLQAQSGDRLRARALWKRCAEISEEIHDIYRLAGIYNNLGIDSLESGSLTEAEHYYLKSLSLFREMNSPREMVATLNNLGELAFYRADYSRALAYWNEAVKMAEHSGDSESQVEPLVYQGRLLLKLEQAEIARETLERARRIGSETGVKKGEGQALEGLALYYSRSGQGAESEAVLRKAAVLLNEEADPLAVLNFKLTECEIAAELGDQSRVVDMMAEARKIAATKWDPFSAARMLAYGLLFANETFDSRERARTLRQLTSYPEFLWLFFWASGRQLAAKGQFKKALDEYGRGVTVLKTISSRLPEEYRKSYLSSVRIARFKAEAMQYRNSVQTESPV